jgi:hypothetical protein
MAGTVRVVFCSIPELAFGRCPASRVEQVSMSAWVNCTSWRSPAQDGDQTPFGARASIEVVEREATLRTCRPQLPGLP